MLLPLPLHPRSGISNLIPRGIFHRQSAVRGVHSKTEFSMSEPTPMPLPYENIATAPVVYFDFVAAHGIVSGAIEIELACRHLIPNRSGGVDVKLATSARLRCSPAAAMT